MKRVISYIVPIFLLLLWELLVWKKYFPPSLSTSPHQILIKLFNLALSGTIILHTIYSLGRLILGVLIGTVFGVMSGLLLGQFEKAEKIFSGTMIFLAPIPVVVWIPFMIMFFGTGELFKISLAAIVAFFIIHINTFQAVKSVETDYIELSSIYEKSYIKKIQHVFLPLAWPAILTGSRIVLALGWVVIFFVEYGTAKQGSEGLGWFIQDARAVGRVEDQFAGVTILALMGYCFDILIRKYHIRKLQWSDTVDVLISNRDDDDRFT